MKALLSAKIRALLTSLSLFLCFVTFLPQLTYANDIVSNVDSLIVKIIGSSFICENDTQNLTVSISGVYDSILWSSDANGHIIGEKKSLDVSIDEAGTYTVKVFSSMGDFSNSFLVVESNVYGGIFSEFTNTICLGDSIKLKAFGGNSNSEAYIWLDTMAAQQTLAVSPIQSTIYQVQVTNLQNCTEVFAKEIIVKEIPIASLDLIDTTICKGESLTIQATSNPNYSYQWNTGDQSSSITKVMKSDQVQFEVTITNPDNCEIMLATNTILTEDPIEFDLISNEGLIIDNVEDSISIEVVYANGDNNDCIEGYKWFIKGDTLTNTLQQLDVQFNSLDGYLQTICVEPISSCVCDYQIKCLEFLVPDRECVGYLEKQVFEACVGEEVIIEGSSNGGKDNLNFIETMWSVDNVDITGGIENDKFALIDYTDLGEKISSIELLMKKAGTYTVKWLYSYDDCTDKSREATIIVKDKPDLDFSFDNSFICEGDEFVIQINPTNNILDYNYELTYNIGSQNIDTLTPDQDNRIIISDYQSKIKVDFVILNDLDTGCKTSYSDSDTIEFNNIYQKLEIDAISVCQDNDLLYSTTLMVSGGSEDYIFEGVGTVIMDTAFMTPLIIEGNNTLIEVSDNYCPNYDTTYHVSHFCKCEEQATALKSNLYKGCVNGSVSVEIVDLPIFSTTDSVNNILYFNIYDSGINNKLIDRQRFTVDHCISGEPCFASIEYKDDLFIPGEEYKVVSYISKLRPQEDSINFNFRCKDSIRYTERPVDIIFEELQDLQLNKYEDTVCIGSQGIVYAITETNLDGVYYFNWETDAEESITLDTSINSTKKQIAASFTQAGDFEITLGVQKEINVNRDICESSQKINIFVADEQAPPVIEIEQYPGNIYRVNTEEDYCYQWGAQDKDSGKTHVTKSDSLDFWFPNFFNPTDHYLFVDVWDCTSQYQCRTRTYFNSSKPVNTDAHNLDEFNVYPNPTSGQIFIEFPNNLNTRDVYLELYDILGQRYIPEIFQIGNSQYVLGVDNLGITGSFYLFVRTEDKVLHQELLIIH